MAETNAPPQQQTALIVYKPEVNPFPAAFRPSQLGLTIGILSATLTHAIMDKSVKAVGTTAAASIHGVGYLAEKVAEHFGGPMAGLSVLYTRHAVANTTRDSIKAYSPLTAMATSAVVGTVTAYTVTAGEIIVKKTAPIIANATSAAISKIYDILPSKESLLLYMAGAEKKEDSQVQQVAIEEVISKTNNCKDVCDEDELNPVDIKDDKSFEDKKTEDK
jgi:hypothetical protein